VIAIDLLFEVIVASNDTICIGNCFVNILNIGFVIDMICQLTDH
jgi:hypothetical protein